MKIYPNQHTAILQILQDVTKQKMVLDKTLQVYFKQNPKWGSKDRKAVAQCSYDICRNHILLKELTQPNQSIVDTYISLLDESFKFEFENIKGNYKDLDFNILYSIPEALSDLFEDESSLKSDDLIAMHREAPIYIRVNTSQIDYEVFCDVLKSEGIAFESIRNIEIAGETFELNAIKLFQKIQPNSDFYIRNQPYFEFQDIGSQIISKVMPISTQATILETCAGNGGKSIHILDQMEPTSQLISMDLDEKKLQHLQLRVAKLFNKKVVTALAEPDQIERYKDKVDLMFMDMPCSGSGTIKRQPDLKYRIDKALVMKKCLLQRQIFENFEPCLKSKGTIVYSTCSLFSSENKAQIDWIVARGYTLTKSIEMNPSKYSGDGFFVAVLQRN